MSWRCHSDIHAAHGEWGPVHYPLVPGHEIAGIVKAVGTEVSKYQVDDRVGVGCMVDSCGECEHCRYSSKFKFALTVLIIKSNELASFSKVAVSFVA